MKRLVLCVALLAAFTTIRLPAQNAPAAPPKPLLMAADADPSFEVATIKPNNSGDPRPHTIANFHGEHFVAENVCLNDLLQFAYNLKTNQILDEQDWMTKDRYDIAATMTPEGRPSVDQVRIMLQKLMTDRFSVKVHHEQRELPVYVITIAKGGFKLQPSDGSHGMGDRDREIPGGMMFSELDQTSKLFATILQQFLLDRPVLDHTGLTGKYDFIVSYAPDDMPPPPSNAPVLPNIFEAFQEQLGLKLTPQKTQADVLVIDHADHPSDN